MLTQVFAIKVHNSNSPNTYGAGTSSLYGHVKLSDNYSASAGSADQSVGASSQAVYNTYSSSVSRYNDVIGELTANGNRLYMDYKNGKYGYNTSANRGADTFHPFNDLDDVKVYSNQWTHYRSGESHDSGVFASYTLQQRSKVYTQCAASGDASGGCWSNVENGRIYPAGTVIEFSYSYGADEWNRYCDYFASLAAIST